ncbi:hypothetical protein JOQ06_026391 [Pogonophryne albipinna]|uniref:DTHCT domain-containing protein n=1 Tax=Pogonophryne albipinna TaxID=1090488 RepID=A0AAD6B8J8_9TELE|nr:hypothetical protein JOQ06_026391 [Pogonophryne albipinna]
MMVVFTFPTQSEDLVMKMEFGEDAENTEPSEDNGLAAPVRKRTKAQPKEKAASKTGKQSTLQFKAVGKNPKKSVSDEESEEASDDMFDNMSDDEMDSEGEIAPRVVRTSRAPVKYSMSDSEDEFDDVGKESAPKRKPVISDDDSFLPEPMADREVDSPVPPPKAPEPAKKTARSKPAAKAAQAKSSSQSDDAVPAPKAPVQRKPKAAAPKKPAAARKPAAKKSAVLDVRQPSIMDSLTKSKPVSTTAAKNLPSFGSSDSEAEAKAAKPKPVKRKQVLSDGDDDSDSSGDLMSRLKAKKTTSKKTKRWDEDESFNISDEEAVAPVATAVREVPARARKAVIYKLDSDSDSSQF